MCHALIYALIICFPVGRPRDTPEELFFMTNKNPSRPLGKGHKINDKQLFPRGKYEHPRLDIFNYFFYMLFAHFLTSILVHVIRTLTLNSWIVWGNINCKKHDLVNKQIDTDCKQFDGKLRDLIYLLVALIFCYICRSLNACHSLTSFSKNEQKKLSLHASFLHHATVITQSSSRKKLKGGKRNIFQQSTTVISADRKSVV